MSEERTTIQKGYRVLVRGLLIMGIATTFMAAAPEQAAAQSFPGWQVFIHVLGGMPATVCVGDKVPIHVFVSLQPTGGKPTAPPLIPGGTISARASHGTLAPASGTWSIVGGSGLRFTYSPTSDGAESISITANAGSLTGTTIALPTKVSKCEYEIGLSALQETKADVWWWIATFEGSGTFGTSGGSNLAGEGTYSYHVDGLWKSKDDTLHCGLVNPIEGSSSFDVSGSKISGGVLVSINFSNSQIPATEYKCIDKEGKESQEPMWSGSEYDPNKDFSGTQNMLFSGQGGEWPVKFGSNGSGAVYVIRRDQ